MSALRYVELFAGAGGLSMGLDAAGFIPMAHAEIEPHARAVLRYHWPEVPLYGDVAQMDGTQFRGVTLLSGGSPCQDLSVAGKRAGLGGARSGLFHEQVRLWKESEAPYFLWENVLGALSSNTGHDFAAVLSAIVGADVAVPTDGWKRGGVASGRDAVAAWRVLDLQHFGPPQRRVRVFILAARTGGVDPAEVLALSEGVCGHPSPRQQQRESVARGIAGGFRSIGWDGEFNARAELVGTLKARAKSGGVEHGVIAFHQKGGAVPYTATRFAQYEEGIGQLRASGGDLGGGSETIIAFHHTKTPISDRAELVGTLQARTKSGGVEHGVIAFHPTQTPVSGDVSPSLGCTSDGMGVMAFGNSGMESWKERDIAITLAARDAKSPNSDVVGTLNASDVTKWGCNQWTRENKIALDHAGPRRLTPRECERLMSWPDDHTRMGIKEDGTPYLLPDTARYRLCGNGVGSVCVAWFAKRLAARIRAASCSR